jgi:membrane-associated phospholipid phosphatase
MQRTSWALFAFLIGQGAWAGEGSLEIEEVPIALEDASAVPAETLRELTEAGIRLGDLLASPGSCGFGSFRECALRSIEKLEAEADFLARAGTPEAALERRQLASQRRAYLDATEAMATGAREGSWVTWLKEELKLAWGTVKALPKGAIAGGAGVGGWLIAKKFDQNVYEHLNLPEQKVPVAITETGDILGSYVMGVGAFVPFLIVGHYKPRDPRWNQTAEVLFAGSLVKTAIVRGIKAFELEPRPRNAANLQGLPSGHAADAFFTATVLCRIMGKRWCASGFASAAFVGFTRVASGWHTVGQVSMGTGIGIMTGIAAVTAYRSRGGSPSRFAQVFESEHVVRGTQIHRSLRLEQGRTDSLGGHTTATLSFIWK